MDIKYLAVLLMAFYCGSSSAQGTGSPIQVSQNVSAFMGTQAQLTCKYIPEGDMTKVLLIRWSRYSDDGKSLSIVASRIVHTEEMEFKKLKSGFTFSDHGRLFSETTGTYVTLNISIDTLACKDVGKYECSVVDVNIVNAVSAVAEVNIEVHPKTPTFSTEELQVTVNTTFELRCEAEVGTPPHVIAFSYQAPGTNVYTLVQEGVETTVTPVPDQCTNIAVSTLELTMTEDLDNSQYMCSLAEARLGADGTPLNFDEIMLKVYRETTTTTTTTTTAPSTTPKEGEVSDDGSSARGVQGSLSALLCSLLVAFLSAMMTTAS